MGEGWRRKGLADVVTLQRGFDLPAQMRRPGRVPILGSFGVTGWHDHARVAGPGVTIGRSGASIGVATYSASDFWPLNTALYVRDFQGNSPQWVYYLLHSIDFTAYNSGSAQPSLNRNFLARIPVALPPLDEQRRIAGVLGALDDLIDTNRMLVERLWLALEAAFAITSASAEVVLVGECIELRYGRALPAHSRVSGPVAVVGSAGVVGSHDQALVKGPGVVVGRKGTVGKVTWVGCDFFPIDTAFYVKSELPMAYCYFALRSMGFDHMNTDSAVPGLNRSNALHRPFPRPTDQALKHFVATADPLLSAVAALSQEVDANSRVRDELLPLLMSGAVRVTAGAGSLAG